MYNLVSSPPAGASGSGSRENKIPLALLELMYKVYPFSICPGGLLKALL